MWCNTDYHHRYDAVANAAVAACKIIRWAGVLLCEVALPKSTRHWR